MAPRSGLDLHFLTLFPELFAPVLGAGLLGKAAGKGLFSYNTIQIRDFARDRYRTVDDTPYGGGEGMLLKADVLFEAWKSAMGGDRDAASTDGPAGEVCTIYLSPQGELFNQDMAKELSRYRKLILVCGHYEGVDERFIERCVDREVSIGDYVLTGGELPALVMADAIVRLLPGVVGNEDSISKDSLEEGGLLKYPQYTRPRDFQGSEVPEVLLSGNHQQIAAWRRRQMEERTARKRPDLWGRYQGKKR